MALDTRNKRASALGATLLALTLWPHPDGTVDQADRQQVPGYYAGITAASLVVVLPSAARTYTTGAENRDVTLVAEDRLWEVSA